MTKTELIENVSKKAGITKTTATTVLNAFTEAIKESLKKKQKVILVGFGTFTVRKRASRKGRNPRTGEEISIPASNVPMFSAGKQFKDVVNERR